MRLQLLRHYFALDALEQLRRHDGRMQFMRHCVADSHPFLHLRWRHRRLRLLQITSVARVWRERNCPKSRFCIYVQTRHLKRGGAFDLRRFQIYRHVPPLTRFRFGYPLLFRTSESLRFPFLIEFTLWKCLPLFNPLSACTVCKYILIYVI